MKRIVAILLLLPLLLFGALARAAVPTADAVEAEIKAGRYEQAESMMREVVQARPKSARAHYVLAEILAHNGRTGQASSEAALARELDPAIGFTDPAKFARFEELLKSRAAATSQPRVGGGALATPGAARSDALPTERAQRVPAAPREAERSSGVPGWLWLAGLALVGVVAWRVLSARRQTPVAPVSTMASTGFPAAPGTGVQAGYAPGMQPQPGYGPGMQPGVMQGRGSGMMGVGLGVAGGVAAGMLAERMLHGNEAHAATPDAGSAGAAGGVVPGAFDDGAGDALRDRSIDFGNGGADWDAGGGAADAGGGDGGSSDGW